MRRPPSILAAICALLVSGPLWAQAASDGQSGRVAATHMHMVLERTFLNIDVLELDVCVDEPTARRIVGIVGDVATQDAADSITTAVIRAAKADTRIHLLRGTSLDRFVDGMVTEQQNAVRAGLLDDSTHQAVRAALPEWFSVLRDRGLHRDDEIVYAFRGDTVHTTYISANGDTLLRHTVAGWQRRTSVLATFFAPGSSFRDGLIESLDHRHP